MSNITIDKIIQLEPFDIFIANDHPSFFFEQTQRKLLKVEINVKKWIHEHTKSKKKKYFIELYTKKR